MKNSNILKKRDTNVYMIESIKKMKLIKLFIFASTFFYTNIYLSSQTYLLPNYSFENDTNYKDISPWKIEGKFYFYSSYNMNFATNGKVFIGIESSYLNDTIYNTKLTCNFPVDKKYNYLKFESIFESQFYLSKFNLKIKLTNTDTLNNKKTVICELDTFIDTSSIYSDKDHKIWSSQEIDLRKHYINFSSPDTCIIEFNCNIIDKPPIDFFQTLLLDNIRFESELTEIESIKTDEKFLIIYPNPNNGKLTVKYQGNQSIQNIEIVDMNGRTVYLSDVNSNESIHDVSLLPNGIYTIRARLNSNEILTEKLSIQ